MQLQDRQSCDPDFGQIRRQKGHCRQKLRRWNQGTLWQDCRNTGSLICWWWASPATPEASREESTRRSSSREPELSLLSKISTRTMSSPLASWSTTSTSRTSRKRTLRPLSPGSPPARKSGRGSQRPTGTCPVPRPMIRLTTSSSSSAGSASERLIHNLGIFKPTKYRHIHTAILERY